jgi:hypothetical protein
LKLIQEWLALGFGILTTLLNYCKIIIEIDTKAGWGPPNAAAHGDSRGRRREAEVVIRVGIMLMLALAAAVGCSLRAPYSVTVAEEEMVRHCNYIAALSENSDMGAFQIHPKLTYDGRDAVLRKAELLNATHVVFLADHPSAAAVLAYHCPE